MRPAGGGCRVVATALALAATPVAAQQQPPDDRVDSTYAACALYRSGDGVLVGLDGPEVGSFGWFSAPKVGDLFAWSDSASAQFRVAEESYASGAYMRLFGTLAYVGGWALLRSERESEARVVGSLLVGGGLLTSSLASDRLRRADDALNRALWWHNASLAGAPWRAPWGVHDQADAGVDDELARAVLLGLAGFGVGLAASSHEPWAWDDRGLFEALGVGLAEDLLGRVIDSTIYR